ncbi:MAG: amidohydrolase family protein [Desulfovibrio sp.]|nr:amidohydrolase family protein [Desulfovibrio sp.]
MAPKTHPRHATQAIRAKTIITLAGETAARGKQLFAPLRCLDNGVLLLRAGRVLDVLPFCRARLPAGCALVDMGPVCLIPACVNAHVHLELTHLAGKTLWGQGFVSWLASLIPLLCLPPNVERMTAACQDMRRCGTLYVGNIAGSLPEGMALADAALHASGLHVNHFCEWFGFGAPYADGRYPWPPRCRAYVLAKAARRAAPGGHALYSTGPDVLCAAHAYCMGQGLVFSFHLAESPEEHDLLTSGSGGLRQLYDRVVLPRDWTAPGLSPVAYAQHLGLLGPGTLAVHCVQVDATEVRTLAASQTAVCLCPRSNRNLGVGCPPLAAMLQEECLLCLGTDGLTSNDSLDVLHEALWLRETLDVPPQALIRMLTVNGASALRFCAAGRLEAGGPASFCVLPQGLTP